MEPNQFRPSAESQRSGLRVNLPWIVILTFVLGQAGGTFLLYQSQEKLRADVNAMALRITEAMDALSAIQKLRHQEAVATAANNGKQALELEKRLANLDKRIDLLTQGESKNEKMLITVWNRCKQIWNKVFKDTNW